MGSLWNYIKDSIDKSKNPTLSIVAVVLIAFMLGEVYSKSVGPVEFWYPWWILVLILVVMVLIELLGNSSKSTPKS